MKQKTVKGWALVIAGEICLAEACSKKQMLINWATNTGIGAPKLCKGETIERCEIRLTKKRART